MEAKQVHDFISIYDLEAEQFGPQMAAPRTPLWELLLKATGIFLTITFIVFLVANYHFIRSQVIDWRKNWGQSSKIEDADEDGMPFWWEQKYGLNDKDPNDAAEDLDSDQASNLVEFLYGTDPRDPDTDKDGFLDGQEIKNGYNPNGAGWIDTDKDGIPDWWEIQHGLDKDDPSDARKDFDHDLLDNKREFEYNTNPRKADTDQDGMNDGDEVRANRNPVGKGALQTKKLLVELDPDSDGLLAAHENLFSTDPYNSDTDGDGFSDFHELTRGFDPTGEGMIEATIEIPKIEVDAPIIWSQSTDEKEIIADLDKGVVHYPGSAFPSMNGNSYLTGHSSYYSWSKSQYKSVFQNLGKLERNDEVIIHISLKNGKKLGVVYQVATAEVVSSSDERLFREYEGYELTLVTCWPLGTDWKRLMVKADLKSPEFE